MNGLQFEWDSDEAQANRRRHMKRSGSSARGKRTPGKRSDTAPRTNVRYVKFSPEEMAYDAPADVSDPKRFVTIARGRREWEQFLSFKGGYVRLDRDLREFFEDDRTVNETLRKAMELAKINTPAKRRKTA